MEPIVKLENVDFIYQEGTPFEHYALKGINLEIMPGESVGIIGPTGSGKSTLVQHFNGLLKASRGSVFVDGRDVSKKRKREKGKKDGEKKEKPICFEVGLVFQYPEYQLFEETVYEDVAFGPRNMKLSEEEVDKRIKDALQWLGLDFDRIKDRSPFSLSGGEMRRVALAGVLAMRPRVLVLDEPTAGLDPKGQEELRILIERFKKELGMTLVMVNHEMGDIARMVDHLIVIHKGEIAADGKPAEIFQRKDWLKEIGLGIPPYMELMEKLREKGIEVSPDAIDLEDAVKEIKKAYSAAKGK